MEVTFRIAELKAGLDYGKAHVVVSPVGDLFYSVEVPDETVKHNGIEEPIINSDGIKVILRNLQATLVLDADNEF